MAYGLEWFFITYQFSDMRLEGVGDLEAKGMYMGFSLHNSSVVAYACGA